MSLRGLQVTPPWEWPRGAARQIMDVLANERAEASERLLAAELAGDVTIINDDFVELLLQILDRGDFSDALRCQAALSLGPVLEEVDIDGFDAPFGEPPISEGMFRSIQAALEKIHADNGMPKIVRRRALEASVRAPRDWHRAAIRAAYGRRDRDWKVTAVFAMRWVDGFEREILESLESDDGEIRYQAVCAAGNWGVEAAWPHVAPILETERGDRRMLLAAIEAVGSLRPKMAPDVLGELIDDEDEEIAEAAMEVITLSEADFLEVSED
ncbi:MAG: hypothetical protein RIF41_11055 [Polyangiaceae bacterium]